MATVEKKAKELEVSLVGSGYSDQIAAGSQPQGNLAFALRYLSFAWWFFKKSFIKKALDPVTPPNGFKEKKIALGYVCMLDPLKLDLVTSHVFVRMSVCWELNPRPQEEWSVLSASVPKLLLSDSGLMEA